jgi:hypothetical protein
MQFLRRFRGGDGETARRRIGVSAYRRDGEPVKGRGGATQRWTGVIDGSISHISHIHRIYVLYDLSGSPRRLLADTPIRRHADTPSRRHAVAQSGNRS